MQVKIVREAEVYKTLQQYTLSLITAIEIQ